MSRLAISLLALVLAATTAQVALAAPQPPLPTPTYSGEVVVSTITLNVTGSTNNQTATANSTHKSRPSLPLVIGGAYLAFAATAFVFSRLVVGRWLKQAIVLEGGKETQAPVNDAGAQISGSWSENQGVPEAVVEAVVEEEMEYAESVSSLNSARAVSTRSMV